MAVSSRSVRVTDLQMQQKWKEREISPERTKVWTQNPNQKLKSERKVPVVYYLTRNGQLEHPHFMEVHLSSPDGLYLRGTRIFHWLIFLIIWSGAHEVIDSSCLNSLLHCRNVK